MLRLDHARDAALRAVSLVPGLSPPDWEDDQALGEVLQAAETVYRLFGVPGLETTQMPPLRQLVGKRLGYYIREGKHSMTPGDWKVFLDFADKHFRK